MTNSQTTEEKRKDILKCMAATITADTEMKKILLEGFMYKNPYAAYRLEEFIETMNDSHETVIRGFKQLGELL